MIYIYIIIYIIIIYTHVRICKNNDKNDDATKRENHREKQTNRQHHGPRGQLSAVCWAAKSPPPVASLTPRHPPGRQPGPRSSLQAVGTDHLLFETKPGFCHEAFEVFGRILEGFEQEMFILSNMCGQNLWNSQSGLLRAKLGRHCFCNVGTDLFFQRAIWIENWETHSAMTILSAILHGQTSVAERALNLKQICQEH